MNSPGVDATAALTGYTSPVDAMVLYFSADRVLLARRDRIRRWDVNLPGGKLEPGETLHDGMAREAFEETGLRLPPRNCGLSPMMWCITGRVACRHSH